MQQTAPNTASDNVALNVSTEVQLSPKLNFAHDFSQVPVRTGNSIEPQATQLNDFHIMNSRITQNRLLQRQNMCPGGVYDESERTCRPYDERDRRQCSTVYVWGPQGENVGHASIDIEGTYASFWPDSVSYSAQDGFLDLLPGVSTPSTTHTFSDDVAAEGKAPDHAVQICCLDINAMRAKWARLRSEAFELFTNNCSTTVGRILYAGLVTDPDMDAQIDAEFPHPGTNCLGSGGDLPGIDEPLDVKNAAECLRDHNCAQTR